MNNLKGRILIASPLTHIHSDGLIARPPSSSVLSCFLQVTKGPRRRVPDVDHFLKKGHFSWIRVQSDLKNPSVVRDTLETELIAGLGTGASPVLPVAGFFFRMTVSLIILLFGYAYPAYHCYKTVKRTKVNNTEEKSDYKDLTSWCQYWILIAMFTVVVTVLDTFIFWFPIYSEVKLVIFICLFCSLPKTTEVVATNWYENLVHPFFEEHEDKIDSKLKDLKTISFWRNAYSNAWDLLKKGRQTLQPHQKNAEKHVAAPTSVSPVPHILSVPTNSITYVAESTDVSETISAGSVGNPTFFVDEDGPSCHCLPAEQRAAEAIAAATSTPVGSRSVSVEESSSGSIHPDSG